MCEGCCVLLRGAPASQKYGGLPRSSTNQQVQHRSANTREAGCFCLEGSGEEVIPTFNGPPPPAFPCFRPRPEYVYSMRTSMFSQYSYRRLLCETVRYAMPRPRSFALCFFCSSALCSACSRSGKSHLYRPVIQECELNAHAG